jgi:hypothetical protein
MNEIPKQIGPGETANADYRFRVSFSELGLPPSLLERIQAGLGTDTKVQYHVTVSKLGDAAILSAHPFN